GRSLHGAENPMGGTGRRITGTVQQARDMVCLLPHIFHVGRAGAYVFSSNVFPAQRFHEPSVSAKDLFPVIGLVVANDDGLPSTARKLSEGVLVSHAPGEAQGILNGGVQGIVFPEASATHRRSQSGAVDSNDAPVFRCRLFRAQTT